MDSSECYGKRVFTQFKSCNLLKASHLTAISPFLDLIVWKCKIGHLLFPCKVLIIAFCNYLQLSIFFLIARLYKKKEGKCRWIRQQCFVKMVNCLCFSWAPNVHLVLLEDSKHVATLLVKALLAASGKEWKQNSRNLFHHRYINATCSCLFALCFAL